MSAIFGMIEGCGEQVYRRSLEAMMLPMRYYGPDGQYLWCDENAGLGQLQSNKTPESVGEKFPLTDVDKGLVFVSAARIDNRDELFALLHVDEREKLSVTDSQLIFYTYLKFGAESVHYLLGDWSFAVWHKHEKKLFLARDHQGVTALYYHFNGKQFAFSSSLKAILTLDGFKKELNVERFAEIQLAISGNGIHTIYKNVFRVPPGVYIILNNNLLNTKLYWEPHSIPPIRYANTNDYYDHFAELFKTAVQCRLRTHQQVGSTLSSGFDSGAVTAMAAHVCQQNSLPLHTYTATPIAGFQVTLAGNKTADESYVIDAYVNKYPNIVAHCGRLKPFTPLEAISLSAEIHHSPIVYASNAYWLYELMYWAKASGCSSILTGQGGNATISWPLHASNYSLLHQIGQRLSPFLTWAFRSQATVNGWFGATALAKSTNMAAILQALAKQYKKHPNLTLPNKATQQHLLRLQSSIVGANWHEIGAWFGVDMRDPTRDKRIVEFCLAIPDAVFYNVSGRRLLVRRGLANMVPQQVLNSPLKGYQAADMVQRVVDEKDAWLGKLAQLPVAVDTYIDKATLISGIQALGTGNYGHDTQYLKKCLARGMNAICFLESLGLD